MSTVTKIEIFDTDAGQCCVVYRQRTQGYWSDCVDAHADLHRCCSEVADVVFLVTRLISVKQTRYCNVATLQQRCNDDLTALCGCWEYICKFTIMTQQAFNVEITLKPFNSAQLQKTHDPFNPNFKRSS